MIVHMTAGDFQLLNPFEATIGLTFTIAFVVISAYHLRKAMILLGDWAHSQRNVWSHDWARSQFGIWFGSLYLSVAALLLVLLNWYAGLFLASVFSSGVIKSFTLVVIFGTGCGVVFIIVGVAIFIDVLRQRKLAGLTM